MLVYVFLACIRTLDDFFPCMHTRYNLAIQRTITVDFWELPSDMQYHTTIPIMKPDCSLPGIICRGSSSMVVIMCCEGKLC